MARADVAIWAPLAGPLYGVSGGVAGGAETQSVYLARSLAERGLRVRHLVVAEGGAANAGGVEVQPIPTDYARGGLARRRSIVAALRAADARVYVQRSAGDATGIVAAYARCAGRRFVFSSSSESDFTRDLLALHRSGTSLDEWPTRLQYLVGLRLAHRVVVQTETQRNLALHERGVRADVIASFCEPAPVQDRPREAFLWIGGISGVKDPLAFVELARRVPEARFVMVASSRGREWAELERDVLAQAQAVSNLELRSAAPREQILDLYSVAVAVVNTSWFEGFPNTFLEGWARGVPALSLRVDPDGVIERNGLGVVCAGSIECLAKGARSMWARRDAVDPEATRRYVRRVHDPAVVSASWAQLVEELLAR